MHGLLVTPVGDDLTFLDRIRKFGSRWCSSTARPTERTFHRFLSTMSREASLRPSICSALVVVDWPLSVVLARSIRSPIVWPELEMLWQGSRSQRWNTFPRSPCLSSRVAWSARRSVEKAQRSAGRGVHRERSPRNGRAPGACHAWQHPSTLRTSLSSATTTSISRAPRLCRCHRSASRAGAGLGNVAVDLLMREAAEGSGFQHEHVVLQPELVVRGSTVA